MDVINRERRRTDRSPNEHWRERFLWLRGHGQGLLFRNTTKVLTVCGEKICIVQWTCPFVNMPLLTLTIPCSHPETCCFLRPKFTFLEREGVGRELKKKNWKHGQKGGEHPERILPGCRIKKRLLYYNFNNLLKHQKQQWDIQHPVYVDQSSQVM